MLLLLQAAYVPPRGDPFALRRQYEIEIDADDEEVIATLLLTLTATGFTLTESTKDENDHARLNTPPFRRRRHR